MRPFLAAAKVLLLATAPVIVACAPPTTLVFPGADAKDGSPVLECTGAITLSHFDGKAIHEVLPDLPLGRSGKQRFYNFRWVDAVYCVDRYVIPAGKHLILAWYEGGGYESRVQGVGRDPQFSSASIPLEFDATNGHRYVVCPGVEFGAMRQPIAWHPRIVEIERQDTTPPGNACARTDLRSLR
jgi:hypothetical protein